MIRISEPMLWFGVNILERLPSQFCSQPLSCESISEKCVNVFVGVGGRGAGGGGWGVGHLSDVLSWASSEIFLTS